MSTSQENNSANSEEGSIVIQVSTTEEISDVEESEESSKVIIESEESEDDEIECCVCYRVPDHDKTLIFVDKKLCDITKTFIKSINTPRFNRWPNCLVHSCCGEHYICVGCLHKISTNFNNHPIGPKNPLIACPYPYDDGCVSESGLPNYFSHSDIRKVINDEQVYTQYLNHADRYQFPGYEIVKCPRPMIMQNYPDGTCGAMILVPIEKIVNSEPGRLIVECDQNEHCRRKSCYHCHSLVRKYGPADGDDMYCDYCITSTENTNERAYNRYFYKSDKRIKDGKWLFYRNEELTKDIVIPQLLEIIEFDRGYIRCFECLTVIQKTEQCNTVTCCKVERCYACGRSGSPDQDLGDHWDSTGIKGCPRFDYACFWNEWANCGFECLENTCYNHNIGDCKEPSHQHGINRTILVRKKAMIYHSLKSLLPALRKEILQEIVNIKKLKPFVPTFISSDYRTYIADIVHRKQYLAKLSIGETQAIIDEMSRQLSEISQKAKRNQRRIRENQKQIKQLKREIEQERRSLNYSQEIDEDNEALSFDYSSGECYIEDDSYSSDDDDGIFIDMADIEECERILKKIGNIHFNLIKDCSETRVV